jgi:arginyl-tRNA synthetase
MPFDKAKQRIAGLLAEACKSAGVEASAERILASLEEPRERGHGDLSSSICFELAKQAGKAPREIALAVTKRVTGEALIAKVETAGAGYINFFFNHAEFGHTVLDEALAKREKYGAGKKLRQKVLVEYPSINPNKPWHIGHARNAVLGDSLARITEFCCYAV